MRVLLLSDIHANLEALESCLDAAPAHDAVANLGDIVGYGANPNEVVARVQQLKGLIIRGNHDKACSGLTSMEDFNPIAKMSVLWTRTMLSRKNQEWLRALSQGPGQLQGLADTQFAHGSPLDEDEYILMPSDATEPLRSSSVPVTFFGHTHIQGGFSLTDGRAIAHLPAFQSSENLEQASFSLLPGTRYLINPGSVGQPRDRDWRAAFALFDSDAQTVTYFRVPYPVERAQTLILDAGLPEQLAERLAVGR